MSHTQHFYDLMEFTHKELVAHLRFYNFHGSALKGKKVQLAARLLDHLEEFGQTPDTLPPRTYLMVPYRYRQRAKQLGAKWDPIWKSWYAPAYSRDINRLTRLFLLRDGDWTTTPKFTRASSHTTEEAPSPRAQATQTEMNLKRARELTRLNRLQPLEAFNIFLGESNGLRPLNKSEYKAAFEKIITQENLQESERDLPLTPSERVEVDRLVEELYHALKCKEDDCLDYDNDHLIRYLDIVFAISILTGGSRRDKINEVFKIAGWGMLPNLQISRLCFQRYLTAFFKTLAIVEPVSIARMGVSPSELAVVTTEDLFESGELASDSHITLEECHRWCKEDL